MQTLPISELKDYTKVLNTCKNGEPVVLTDNGKSCFIVMNIQDYEKEQAEKKLLAELRDAENAVKNDNDWLTMDQLKDAMQND